MNYRRRILSLALIVTSIPVWADNLRDYIKQPEYEDFVLSPTGEYMAIIRKSKDSIEAKRDKSELQILDMNKNEIVGVLRFKSGQHVMGMKKGDSVLAVQWAKDRRLIVRAGLKLGRYEREWMDPDVVAVDIDGQKQVTIFGPNAGRYDLSQAAPSKSSAALGDYASMYVRDLLRDDPNDILVVKYPWAHGVDGDTKPVLMRLNVHNGRQTTVEKIDIENASVSFDKSDTIRFAETFTRDRKRELYYRESANDEFKKLYSVDEVDGYWTPIAFSENGQKVLVASNIEASQQGLYWWDPLNQSRTEIFRHPQVDVGEGHVIFNGKKQLIGVRTYDGKPSLHLFGDALPEQKIYKLATQAFPGKQVSIESTTNDGSKAVVFVSSDTDSGSYFFIDLNTKKANRLADRLPWMKDKKLAEIKPITIKARDGLDMPGYLTLPVGKQAKNLPLVMIIHGGPYGPRDYWGYDPDVQLLASRGYAVLQVNFRGSGGYGRDYEYGAWGLWGTVMQDDLVDATQWAINQGIADRNRICLFGHSYGGYASVWGITRDADLYKCAVASMGVYDLTYIDEEENIANSESLLMWVKKAIGNDDAKLKSVSPVYHVNRIKASLLLSHGEEDDIAPIEHANRLREALKKSGKPYEYMEFDKEGHGFANEENREKFFAKVLGFLDKNIGH